MGIVNLFMEYEVKFMTNDEKIIIINKIKSLATELCDDRPDKE